MKNVLYSAVLTVVLSFGTGRAEPLALSFIDNSVNKDTKIHFSGKFCTECHLVAPKPGEPLKLRFGADYIESCRCHGYQPDTYIHPVYIKPSPTKKITIPDDMPLQDGMVTCVTCHEIGLQCQKNDMLQWENGSFLRGAPYSSRTGICRRCHDQGEYKMLDPHNQLDYDGQVIQEKCLYCHTEMPSVEHSSYAPTDAYTEIIHLVGDLTVVCSRCHPDQSRLHPINSEHFVKPTAKILATMQESEKRLGTLLPLDHNGKITCPTCHNPHERGVISPGRVAATGASEKYRLRVPGQGNADRICQACHKK